MAQKKLKPQHQIIVEEVAKGKTQREAYLKAYPQASVKTADVNASKLLSSAKFSEALQNRINRALSHHQVTPEEVIGSAVFNMRASMDDLIDEEGFFDLTKARETGAIDLIKEIEFVQTVDLETNEKIVKHKVKFESPAAARKEVANYIEVEKAPKPPDNNADIARRLLEKALENGAPRDEAVKYIVSLGYSENAFG